MTPLRLALVVPDYTYERWDDPRHCRVEELREACGEGSVDLVVFPEAYECDTDEPQNVVDEWAEWFCVPTLIGVETKTGYQTAAYRNPRPGRGDTSTHLYFKHSSAYHLAFDLPDYHTAQARMFMPIFLNGHALGVEICHDMFFGLVGERLRRAGAKILLDLAGGGVNLRKWSNIVQARSLESRGPMLCTMGGTPDRNKKCQTVAFDAGRLLSPILKKTRSDGSGGFEIFAVAGTAAPPSGVIPDDQEFTGQQYDALLLALGTRAKADITVEEVSSGLHFSGPAPFCYQGAPQWRGFKTRAGRVGVLGLPAKSLEDGLALYRAVPPEGTFDHHLVVYYDRKAPEQHGALLALMKLRAIEHRLCVALLAGRVRELIKTNRYKNIQRIPERSGVFGIDCEFVGGTWSTPGASRTQGIPHDLFNEYLSLVPAETTAVPATNR